MAKKKATAKTKKTASNKTIIEMINKHLIEKGLDNYEFDHIALKSILDEGDCPPGKRKVLVRKGGRLVPVCR